MPSMFLGTCESDAWETDVQMRLQRVGVVRLLAIHRYSKRAIAVTRPHTSHKLPSMRLWYVPQNWGSQELFSDLDAKLGNSENLK